MSLLAGVVGGCALLTGLPADSTIEARLAAIPVQGAAVRGPVTIHWDHRQIPFIEAEHDTDAAFALGLVHAHLRLGQMEVLRRISQGRLSEMGGPVATEIDHALRILDYGKVSAEVVRAMPAEERAWLDAFVAGVNHYQAQVDELPHEFSVLGLDREPWRPEEIITLGRLASTDVTWLVWFRLLQLRDRPDWPDLWAEAIAAGTSSVPSFETAAAGDLAPLETLLTATGKFGSNSIAVAGRRSATGSALMANDPHLGLNLPNLWLIAGVKSPSYHMLGMMVPGLPFVAVGRNPWIAWGGTNMRAASSDLFDVSDLPAEQMREREEDIAVRWWFDETVTIRETAYGPVISDAPPITAPEGEVWALRWIGHRPTDEFTAMLRVNRARTWSEFRSALDGFALSPQNFLYADRDGNIGQVTATHLPRRPPGPPRDIVKPRAEARYWTEIATARDLPTAYNPPLGVLASANNKGGDADILTGYFFSSNDRIQRLYDLLGEDAPLRPEDLARIQSDTYQSSSVALRDRLLRIGAPPDLSPGQQRVLNQMRGWDGRYDPDSHGAVAFEAVMATLAPDLFDEPTRQVYRAAGRPFTLMAKALEELSPERVRAAFGKALTAAAPVIEEYAAWGDIHRLSVNHVLGLVPVIGDRYQFGDLPTGGSRETIWKSGHDLTAERHVSRFGANARHISDLADPDANWFVLMGGQDGWLNSSTFKDQIPLWQAGDYIKVPMTLDRVRATFPLRTELRPNLASR